MGIPFTFSNTIQLFTSKPQKLEATPEKSAGDDFEEMKEISLGVIEKNGKRFV